MIRNLFIRFIAITIATFLLIFIEYKFEVIDYLRFVNSAKTLEGTSIAYSSDGEMLAIGRVTDSEEPRNKKSRKNIQIEIRRVADNSLITSFNSSTTGNLTFSPDNSLIAAGSYNGEVYVWQVSDGELLHSFSHQMNVKSSRMRLLSFAHGGSSIVTLISGVVSSSSNKVNVWNLTNQTNRVLSANFISADLSHDRKILALGKTGNKTVDLYRVDDLTLIKQIEVAQKPSSPLIFSSNDRQIAFVASSPPDPTKPFSRSIYLYNVENGSLSNIFNHPTKESIEEIAMSPDGRYLAASYRRSVPSDFFVGAPRASDARYYGRIRVWRIEDGKQLSTFRGHKYRTYEITFSPDSKFLTSTGADGKVRFWKVPPHNYSWFLMFGGLSLAAVIYSRRSELIGLLNR